MKTEFSKEKKHFILNLKIDAKIESNIATLIDFDWIKKLSDLYRKKQKSNNKFLDLGLSIEGEN